MATSSFDREFVVSDEKAARQLRADLEAGVSSQTVKPSDKDPEVEKKEAIKLLQRMFSA